MTEPVRPNWLLPQALVMPFVAFAVAALLSLPFPASTQKGLFILAVPIIQIAALAWLFVRIRKHHSSYLILVLSLVLSLVLCVLFAATFVLPGIT